MGSYLDEVKKDFDLEKIVSDSITEIKELSPETYKYIISLCDEKLISKLTSSQVKEIAKELLKKMA